MNATKTDQTWKENRKAMREMKAGDERVINGRQVKRLSSQKWEVNGEPMQSAFYAAFFINHGIRWEERK